MSLIGVSTFYDNKSVDVDLSGSLGQVTLEANDPYVGIHSYAINSSGDDPLPADYIKWNGKTKSISVANNTPEYLWVKNGRGLTTKKIFSIHAHTGNTTSGGGCYTKPNYHVHVGNSSTRGGCFTIEKHRTEYPYCYFYGSSCQPKFGCKILQIGSISTTYGDANGFIGFGPWYTGLVYYTWYKVRLYKNSGFGIAGETILYSFYNQNQMDQMETRQSLWSVDQILYSLPSNVFFTANSISDINLYITYNKYYQFGLPTDVTYYDPGCGKTTSTIESYTLNCGKENGELIIP